MTGGSEGPLAFQSWKVTQGQRQSPPTQGSLGAVSPSLALSIERYQETVSQLFLSTRWIAYLLRAGFKYYSILNSHKFSQHHEALLLSLYHFADEKTKFRSGSWNLPTFQPRWEGGTQPPWPPSSLPGSPPVAPAPRSSLGPRLSATLPVLCSSSAHTPCCTFSPFTG